MEKIKAVIKKAIQSREKTAFLFLDSNGMAVIRVDPFFAVNHEYKDGGNFIDSAEGESIKEI